MEHIAKVLTYCKKHGSITVRDAFDLNINSPTKVISNMRLSDQYDVADFWETKVKDDGSTVRYKRYFIKEKETTAASAIAEYQSVYERHLDEINAVAIRMIEKHLKEVNTGG